MRYLGYSKLTETWVMNPSPRPDAPIKLFCLPHAGGSPRVFFPWAKQLPEAFELLPICLPGRGARMDEPLINTIEGVIRPIAQAVKPIALTNKVVLFGHSLGALLAVKLAYELRRQRTPVPVLLVVSGRDLPGAGRRLRLHGLPDRMLVREVQRIYGSVPREILAEPELLSRTLPILRADLAINETCEPTDEAPLDCSILALGGAEDLHVTRTELELWSQLTTKQFRCAQFEGGHFYLSNEPGWRWVISELTQAVDTM